LCGFLFLLQAPRTFGVLKGFGSSQGLAIQDKLFEAAALAKSQFLGVRNNIWPLQVSVAFL
jgi:hypothetical protein